MFVSTIAALSTFYPTAKRINDPAERTLTIYRLIGKVPTLAAFAYRHSMGMPYVHPDNELSYAGNFLSMMYKIAEPKYKLNPVLERALDVLFILHADHEQNCSTSAMRGVGSSHVDPYSAAAAAAAALYGPLHGGANEAVLRMLDEIGTLDKIPAFIKEVKEGKGRLMGFGHRVYKNYDPRANIIKRLADQVFEVTGRNPKLDIALELERIALQDDYFVKRKLYPNVDFYSGLIYQAMKFPVDMFPVLFAIGRMSGWLVAVAGDAPGRRSEDRPPAADLPRSPRSAMSRCSASAPDAHPSPRPVPPPRGGTAGSALSTRSPCAHSRCCRPAFPDHGEAWRCRRSRCRRRSPRAVTGWRSPPFLTRASSPPLRRAVFPPSLWQCAGTSTPS